MKKLFKKVRLWLIRKLGGYTEQYVYHRTVEYRKPTRLVIERTYPPAETFSWMLNSEQDIYSMFVQEAAHELIDTIVKNNFWVILCSDDPIRHTRTYRAELLIVPYDKVLDGEETTMEIRQCGSY